ncbi:MAG: NUDIX domain-containing protein [Thermomicrobiales bacterium]
MRCHRCGGLTEERLTDGRTRPVCRACGLVISTIPKLAVAVVLERDGKVLLGKRGRARAPPGSGLPGWVCRTGERSEDAAVREVREETGYSIELGPLIS